MGGRDQWVRIAADSTGRWTSSLDSEARTAGASVPVANRARSPCEGHERHMSLTPHEGPKTKGTRLPGLSPRRRRPDSPKWV